MNDFELEKEAKRIGWTVEYLKSHLAKEERIKQVSNRLKNGEIIKKFKEGYGEEWEILGEDKSLQKFTLRDFPELRDLNRKRIYG